MNYKYLIFSLLVVSSFVQSMHLLDDDLHFEISTHIKDLATIVTFGKNKKSIFEWLRDNKYENFGKIPLYSYSSDNGEDLFKEIGTIQEADNTFFGDISSGKCIYCVLSEDSARGSAPALEQKYGIIRYDYENRVIINKNMGVIVNQLQLYVLKKLYADSKEK